jgi:hypothetical protein
MDDLVTARIEIAGLAPDYFEAVAQNFREEWSSACALFGVTLARRSAIEQAIGEPLDLLPPTAATAEQAGQADLGELARPGSTMQSLSMAIGQITSARETEIRERRQPLTFDPDGVFEFIREARLNGRQYSPGDRTTGSLLGEAAFKYCAQTRLLKRVDFASVASVAQ